VHDKKPGAWPGPVLERSRSLLLLLAALLVGVLLGIAGFAAAESEQADAGSHDTRQATDNRTEAGAQMKRRNKTLTPEMLLKKIGKSAAHLSKMNFL
jgi:hypothetical protein